MSNYRPLSLRPASPPSPTVLPSNESALSPDRLVGVIYRQAVPVFAAQALDRLHGSLYASLSYLQLCEPDAPLPHTWVAYLDDEITGVLLFRVQGRSARVLCELIAPDRTQIDAFSACVFRDFPQVWQLVFNAVELPVRPCTWPHQSFAYSENYILTLPDSTSAYIASLGKSTRQTVRGYRNRLLRDHPDFQWVTVDCTTVGMIWLREQVAILQQFKHDSMHARGKLADNDTAETERMLRMASRCGTLGMGTMQGRLCAGALSCRIGDTCVMLLSASDPVLSPYRLGLLTCLWSVVDCIDRGARQCHLLWGRYAYKHQLQAVPHPLWHITIYRSVLTMGLQPVAVLGKYCQKYRVRLSHGLRNWIIQQKHPCWKWLIRRYRLCLKGR